MIVMKYAIDVVVHVTAHPSKTLFTIILSGVKIVQLMAVIACISILAVNHVFIILI
jgi:hypothetical protein